MRVRRASPDVIRRLEQVARQVYVERVPARQQVDACGGEGESEEPPEGTRRRSSPRDEGVRAEEARGGGAVAEEVPVGEGAEERVHGDHVREPGRDHQSEER